MKPALSQVDLPQLRPRVELIRVYLNTLGPEPVRAIYGVTHINNASVGMIVTTARFGPAALSLANQYRYRLSLKDYEGVLEWIKFVSGKS